MMGTMEKLTLKIKKLDNFVSMPEYKTSGASGMDLSAGIEEDIILKPMERKLIPTGIKIEVPLGYEVVFQLNRGWL